MFLDKVSNNTYFQEIHNVLNLNEDIPEEIKGKKYVYHEPFKKYRELLVMIAYLTEQPIDKVTYFKFKKMKSAGFYCYTLDVDKYRFTMKKLNEYGVPMLDYDNNSNEFNIK